MLSGDDLLGPMLTGHPGIKKISFTGSTATGKHIMENAKPLEASYSGVLGSSEYRKETFAYHDLGVATIPLSSVKMSTLTS